MAKVSILLEELAKSLENPDSELVLASEDNEDVLNITTLALVNAASILRTAAKAILKFEPHIDAEDLDGLAEIAAEFDQDEEFSKYSESVDNLLDLVGRKEDLADDLDNAAKLAEALDSSGDESNIKIASVLDEILLSIGTPKGAVQNIKSAEESEIEKLRLKYKKNPEDLFVKGNEAKNKLTEEYTKDIKNQIKEYKPMEHGLSSRYCPDHNGVSLMRVADNTWQCNFDKKIYNYEEGYKLLDGSSVPGSNVSNQTQNLQNPQMEHVSFSNRADKLNENNG